MPEGRRGGLGDLEIERRVCVSARRVRCYLGAEAVKATDRPNGVLDNPQGVRWLDVSVRNDQGLWLVEYLVGWM